MGTAATRHESALPGRLKPGAPSEPPRSWLEWRAFDRLASAGLSITLLCIAVGCRSGSGSSMSWWPGAANNRDLAQSDAAADGDAVRKPSESYPPYPTTSMPNAYSSGEVVPASAESAATGPESSAAPVTYGKAAPAQVGPYQAYPSTGMPPAALSPPEVVQSPAGAPAVSSGAAPEETGSAFPSESRPTAASASFGSADSGGGPGYAASAAAAPVGPGPVAVAAKESVPVASAAMDPQDRYAMASGASSSRFSSAGAPPSSPEGFQGSIGSAPSVASPEGFAPASTAGQTPASFAAPPAATPTPAPKPAGRPDPMYRPGGTSTFRPAQAILDPSADGGSLAWGDRGPSNAPAMTGRPGPAAGGTESFEPQAIQPASFSSQPARP